MKRVAHRGLAAHFPENTLVSFREAIKCGADAVECDVQFTKDEVPILLHDLSLARTSNSGGLISQHNLDALRAVSVHEPQRFSDKFMPTPLSTLAELVDVLVEFPNVIAFVELKKESLEHVVRTRCIDIVDTLLNSVKDRTVLISFDFELLSYANRVYGYDIGWVLTEYNDASQALAAELKPTYLICNKTKLPDVELWRGDWEWFVYDTVDIDEAEQLYARGVKWIESWDVSALM